MSRLSERWYGRFARGKPVFTGKRRHLTSMEVRGVQVAESLGGVCCRCRYIHADTARSAPSLVWVIEPDLDLVERFRDLCPQFFDPINPRIDPTGEFGRMNRSFENLLLNTRSSLLWLDLDAATLPTALDGSLVTSDGKQGFVIPHHHCNVSGYQLSPERIEQPRVVGYLGQPEHLHDAEAIEAAVKSLGLEFRCFGTWDLRAYEKIDIGIAWTRRDTLRDQTRSNIKVTNFVAHGIPSVVCDYESYRDVDQQLGGAALIRAELDEFIEGIAELAQSEALRRSFSEKGDAARQAFSRETLAGHYRAAFADASMRFKKSQSQS